MCLIIIWCIYIFLLVLVNLLIDFKNFFKKGIKENKNGNYNIVVVVIKRVVFGEGIRMILGGR